MTYCATLFWVILGGVSTILLGIAFTLPKEKCYKWPLIIISFILFTVASGFLVSSNVKQGDSITEYGKTTTDSSKKIDNLDKSNKTLIQQINKVFIACSHCDEMVTKTNRFMERAFKPNTDFNIPELGKQNNEKLPPVSSSSIDTSLGKVRLASSLFNATKNGSVYMPVIEAKPNDDVIYRMTITNDSNSQLSNVKIRTIMPPCLDYIGGFAKVYYEDVRGIDQVGAVSDAINKTNNENGVVLMDIPSHHWVYVTFKVKVNESAPAGICAVDNQLVADGNISLSSNDGIVYVTATR